MPRISHYFRLALLAGAAALVPGHEALAQGSYPIQPVRFIVPFPAGGTTDIVARLVAQRMSEGLGQQVIVENRAGAGGTIGASVVAKAPADGYTLLLHNSAFVTASTILALADRLPYNLEKDFAPVSMLVSVPAVLVVHAGIPAKNLKELAEWLRTKPDQSYGSTGPGSIANLWPELYKSLTQVQIQHVPYKGAAPAMQDLISGRIAMMIDQLPTALPHIRTGKARAVVVTTPERSASIGEVATAREQGFPQLEVLIWNSLFAPAATPAAIVQRVQAEAARAVKHPEVLKRLAELSADGVGSTPEAFDRIFRDQISRWTPVIRQLGIKPD